MNCGKSVLGFLEVQTIWNTRDEICNGALYFGTTYISERPIYDSVSTFWDGLERVEGLYIFCPKLFAIYISCPNFLNTQNMPQNNCETPTPRCIEIQPHLRPPEADKTGRRPYTTLNDISIDCQQRLSTRHDRKHFPTSLLRGNLSDD